MKVDIEFISPPHKKKQDCNKCVLFINALGTHVFNDNKKITWVPINH